ncbi:MAG: DUF86 domain-containing protein [Deltaproteobacteria bacterium]|nr:DUF86 domain-containing protein [Deltaproteobacteria bacterium]
MTSDVLLAKLASIGRCLHRIRTVTRDDPTSVHDVDVQKQHFTILEEHKILDADLANRLRAMTGFRTIAMHDYRALNPAILEQDIVHVAEIVPHPQLLLHEVVERVEIDVGEELAREAPDRHAATGLVAAVGNQRFEHGQETRVRDPAA